MSAAQDRAREWLTGMGNWNPGIIRVSQGPEIVRDLLAEPDQANETTRFVMGTLDRLLGNLLESLGLPDDFDDVDYALEMIRECRAKANERDAALATLREVRELHDEYAVHPASEDGYEMWRALGRTLNRGPR